MTRQVIVLDLTDTQRRVGELARKFDVVDELAQFRARLQVDPYAKLLRPEALEVSAKLLLIPYGLAEVDRAYLTSDRDLPSGCHIAIGGIAILVLGILESLGMPAPAVHVYAVRVRAFGTYADDWRTVQHYANECLDALIRNDSDDIRHALHMVVRALFDISGAKLMPAIERRLAYDPVNPLPGCRRL